MCARVFLFKQNQIIAIFRRQISRHCIVVSDSRVKAKGPDSGDHRAGAPAGGALAELIAGAPAGWLLWGNISKSGTNINGVD